MAGSEFKTAKQILLEQQSRPEVHAEAEVRAAAELAERIGPGKHPLAPDRVDVIRKLFSTSKDQFSDAEIAYVLSEAARTKLDPIRQLAVWRDKWTGKIIIHTKIDGLLAIAERTGKYRGALPTRFTWRVGKETIVQDAELGSPLGDDVTLLAATCSVRREGFPEPVTVTRYWADSAPKEVVANSSWDRMGALMLEKVALAGALRRAFPQDLAGLYESAELEQ